MTMSCRDAFDTGAHYGWIAAEYTDFDDDEYVGARGKVAPRKIQEFWRAFSEHASKYETNDRNDFFWGLTAKSINQSEAESEHDLWECYEDGVNAGIEIGFVERYKLTDLKQHPSVQQFGKDLRDRAYASRSKMADDAGFAAGNPRKMTKKEFERRFREEVLPAVALKHERDGIPDRPARREAWKDEINFYIRQGDLPERADGWNHPRWLETTKASLGGSRGRNPYLSDVAKLAKRRKYGYPTPPVKPASSNPAERRLMR